MLRRTLVDRTPHRRTPEHAGLDTQAIATIKDVDTIIPGHSPMMTPKDLQDFQRFVADLATHAQTAMKAGQTVDAATAAFDVSKYPGYKNERVKAAIQAVYDELTP